MNIINNSTNDRIVFEQFLTKNITNFEYPELIENLKGYKAFWFCNNLTSISMPNLNMHSIGVTVLPHYQDNSEKNSYFYNNWILSGNMFRALPNLNSLTLSNYNFVRSDCFSKNTPYFQKLNIKNLAIFNNNYYMDQDFLNIDLYSNYIENIYMIEPNINSTNKTIYFPYEELNNSWKNLVLPNAKNLYYTSNIIYNNIEQVNNDYWIYFNSDIYKQSNLSLPKLNCKVSCYGTQPYVGIAGEINFQSAECAMIKSDSYNLKHLDVSNSKCLYIDIYNGNNLEGELNLSKASELTPLMNNLSPTFYIAGSKLNCVNLSNLSSVNFNFKFVSYNYNFKWLDLSNISYWNCNYISYFGGGYNNLYSTKIFLNNLTTIENNMALECKTNYYTYIYLNKSNVNMYNFSTGRTWQSFVLQNSESLFNISNFSITSSTFFYVPSSIYNTYKNTTGWENMSIYNIEDYPYLSYPKYWCDVVDNNTTITANSYINNSSIKSILFANANNTQGQVVNNCSNLETVVAPKITSLSSYSFNGCSNLKDFIAPNLTYIGDRVFCNCNLSRDIDFSNVDSIGNYVFFNSGITKASFPNLLTLTASYWVFYQCKNLTEIDMNSLTNIISTSGTFQNCENLKNVNLNSLNIIKDSQYCFASCYNLTDVDVNSLTIINNSPYCFYICNNLKDINMNSLVEINNCSDCFAYGYNITNINMNSLTKIIKSPRCFYSCSRSLLNLYMESLTEITNCEDCFRYCNSLVNITMNSLIKIDNSIGCFSCCPSLTNVYMPSLTDISGETFANCNSLLYINLPSLLNVEEKYHGVFYNCSSATISVRDLVNINTMWSTTMKINAIKLTNTERLVQATNSEVLNVFNHIYVPNTLYNDYINATYWSEHASKISNITE